MAGFMVVMRDMMSSYHRVMPDFAVMFFWDWKEGRGKVGPEEQGARKSRT